MNINQITTITMAVMLTAFTSGLAADPGNKDNADKAAHEQTKDKLDKHQAADSKNQRWGNDDQRDDDDWYRSEHRDNDRWNNDGWRSTGSRSNENSNRQSDHDSTRGLERAAESHAMNADKHDDPMDRDRTNRESHWYDFMFREDRVQADKDRIDDLAEKKPRWWWPFNN